MAQRSGCGCGSIVGGFIALAAVAGLWAYHDTPASTTPTPPPAAVAPPVYTLPPLSADSQAFQAFSDHLKVSTVALGAASGKLGTDVAGGKITTTAKKDAAKLRSLAAAEEAWLNAHSPVDCYSSLHYEWLTAVSGEWSAAGDIIAGHLSAYRSDDADAADGANAVNTDFEPALTNCLR